MKLEANKATSNVDHLDEHAWGDVNLGVELDLEEVLKCLDEEVKFLIKQNIYENEVHDDWWQTTGMFVS